MHLKMWENRFGRILGYYKTLKPLAEALLCPWILEMK